MCSINIKLSLRRSPAVFAFGRLMPVAVVTTAGVHPRKTFDGQKKDGLLVLQHVYSAAICALRLYTSVPWPDDVDAEIEIAKRALNDQGNIDHRHLSPRASILESHLESTLTITICIVTCMLIFSEKWIYWSTVRARRFRAEPFCHIQSVPDDFVERFKCWNCAPLSLWATITFGRFFRFLE